MSEINKDDLVAQGAVDMVAQLTKMLNESEAALKAVIRSGAKLGDLFLFSDKISELSGHIKTLRSNITELKEGEAKLAAAQALLAKSNQSESSSTKANTTAVKESTKAKQAANQAENARVKSVRDSQKAMREQAAQVRAQTALLKANTAATKAQTAADESGTTSSKKHTGAIGGMFSSVKNLVLAYITLSAVINLYKKFEAATVALNANNAAMKYTIKNTFELAQTQVFLQDMAKRYGVDLIALTDEYIKYRAAVNESNMTIDAGQKVFESMAKSSAVLGMSLEKTQDIFLALEQMVGKGGIMSEELRRQMGQHLPVAVTAMAVAAKKAGISVTGTVGELMKLMKAGKVIASEVLPYFGEAVEEQLGIKAVKSVDTLRVAQENLKLSFLNFVKAVHADTVITLAYKGWATIFQSIAELFKSDKAKIQEGAGELITGINEKLQKVTTEKEKQLILDKNLDALLNREAKLRQAIADIEEKRTAAKNDNSPMGLARASSLDAKYGKDSEALKIKLGIINQTIDAIGLNYNDLIKLKEKHPLFDDDTEAKARAAAELKIFKDLQAEKLANYIQSQEEMKAAAHKNVIKLDLGEELTKTADNQLQMDMEINITNFKLDQNKKLLGHVKGNEVEMADVKREGAQIQRDLQKKTTDFIVAEDDRAYSNWLDDQKKIAQEEKRSMEDKKDQNISDIETRVTSNVLGLTKALPQGPIKDKRAYGQVEQQYAINVLTTQKEGLQDLINVHNLTIDEDKRFRKELDDVNTALEQAKRDQAQKTYDLQKELMIEGLEYSAKAMNAGFGVFTALQDAQMQRIEWQHEREVNLAGDNVAKKIAAENRYEKEKRKIEKRQAITKKVGSAASVIMNTAVAIMQTLGETGIFGLPLTPIIAGIGALELASVLAQPIPYEFGGDHPGGPARFSERGSELFIPEKSGIPMLTPEHETIANMPAGKFIPSTETQKILAAGVMNNIMRIDMAPTNSLLTTIANKDDVKYINGYKITKNGRYATRS